MKKQFWVKNVLVLASATLLVLFGALLSSESIATALVGGSSSNFQDLVAGVLLFKVCLIVNGLALIGIWAWHSQSADRKSKGTLLSHIRESQCADGRKSISGWLPLAGILIFSALLRVKGLNSGLWYDEVLTLVESVRLPLNQLLSHYPDQNNHPLFSLLGHLSVQSFGESAWALRLPALLFGLASLWALYHLAQTLTNEREAWVSTILMAVSYHHVWFSQNARGYTGLLFWTLLGTWFFLKGLWGPSPAVWFAYAGSMALGMYTHLTAAFIFAGHVLIYIFLTLKQKYLSRAPYNIDWWPMVSFLLTIFFTFQLYSLILPQVLGSFRVQVGGTRIETWTSPIWAIMETFQGLRLGFGTVVGGLAVLLIFFAGVISYLRRNPIVLALLIIPVILGTMPLLLLHRHFYPRFFFPLLGLGVLVLVRGISVVARGLASMLYRDLRGERLSLKLAAVLSVMIILISLFSLSNIYRYPKQDFLGARHYVEDHLKASDRVITVGLASYPYQHYYLTPWKSVKTLEELDAVRSDRNTTWLLYTFPDHMRFFYPELMSNILKEFVLVKEFPGTIAGGTIYVCKAESSSARMNSN